MLRLLLLRHAKSDQSVSERTDDHARPLNKRGREAASRMGEYMAAQGHVPALVLCSTSKRTRETWSLLSPAFARAPKVTFDRNFYLADWPRLLAAIKAAPVKTSPLLVIGHNPGMEQLTFALALKPKSPAERSRLEAVAAKFPTAALAVLDLDEESWSAAAPGRFSLVEFVKPKDLAQKGERA